MVDIHHRKGIEMDANTTECDSCHGTGTRFDSTCAGNVYTHTDAVTPCRWCKGTGRRTVEEPKPWVRPSWYDDEIGDIPDWMLG